MSSEAESVSEWIRDLKRGDAAAAQKLWERYFRQLVELARRRLRGSPRRAADEEDVALSALASFCDGAAAGRFPQLQDRHELWRLLVLLTARKAAHLRRDQQRQKRHGPFGGKSDMEPNLEELVSRDPTPEFAAQIAEECRRLLACLRDVKLEAIALWKMEGHTTDQIAAKLDRARSTVERRLRLIRTLWKEASPV
jgi:DNA-directed RNA polymerase specialized sigma24 family protein